ncbi:TIGR04282 family arsenosugar biosynthesis glycosyltransferase [Kistimonas scapharcae]|uniref:TIGR04282 family arsenosugar biosynthesis glycosyltransferase n=1 Tax=Kistimonas scapharcae TaxID=1036133 RepID=A0ABP8V1W7_9GAMM
MFTHPDARILLFAKPPLPGRVKTRLIPAVGEDGACSAHSSLLCRVGQQLVQWQLAPLQLWAGIDGSFPALFDSWSYQLQSEGNLGERMAHAAKMTLAGEVQKVLFLGSDCPVLTRDYLKWAMAALETSDVVLGPAEDGGYVLLGMRRFIPAVFERIDWGTGQVLAQTRDRLREMKASWQELDTLWDVDRPEDLARYRALPGLNDAVSC